MTDQINNQKPDLHTGVQYTRAELAGVSITKPSGQPFQVICSEDATAAIRGLAATARGAKYDSDHDADIASRASVIKAQRDVLLDLLAHRDRLVAQVTELQASNTELLLRARATEADLPRLRLIETAAKKWAETDSPSGQLTMEEMGITLALAGHSWDDKLTEAQSAALAGDPQ